MTANGLRAFSIVLLNGLALFAGLAILFAGSLEEDVWRTARRTFGIGGLFLLGYVSYLISVALLADVRRSGSRAFRPLLVFYILTAAPMLLITLLVVLHLLFAE